MQTFIESRAEGKLRLGFSAIPNMITHLKYGTNYSTVTCKFKRPVFDKE